ncbi:putative transmembrane GTPase mfn [Ixodes scapularis]
METVKAEDCIEVEKFKDKVAGIRDVLSRDHMKVVFFGRTSNGKSTVINSMLQERILPSGLGHTTNCFLQVEGSDNSEAYLLTEDSNEPKNVESVLQLANALNSESLGESTLVRIFWPKDRCNLLRDDVVLVDSPGIDVSPNLDLWIDKHCLDADVFVLVANAESTLMVTEKNFFHKVSERLSKPNIFILNNRWDASASEPEIIEKVRKQHLERNVAFLVDELRVATRQQAEDRVFFVSAREVLNARLRKQQGLPQHSGVGLAEGYQGRYFEFQDFERKFEECLSKSAVKTKFEQHTQRGKKITNELRAIMDKVYEQAAMLKASKQEHRREQWDRLQFTQQQLELLTEEVKQRISQLVEQVEQQVAGALNEEIRRLELLVNEFERPFHPDSLVLSVYKRELHGYVERGLGSNLRARLSSTLQMSVESSQKEMIGRMAPLIPQEQHPQMQNVLPRHNFEVLYRLNCESLCCDFQEDLEFRFSLGLVNLMKRFMGPRGAHAAMGGSYSPMSVLQLANALNSESLGESTLVRIFWPKDRCNLLRDDVVLVDSPGIDVSPNLDLWIDKHCLDADVFVLVANAESTLMVTEKNFFHKVSERLSKPNIFILNNRWDASASEPEIIEKVRKQHLERNVAFLVDELRVATRQQAEDRVFFVSAREVLNARLRKQQGLPQHSGVGLAEGYQGRYFEFQDFERKFEECLSKSAVKTKFEQHTQRGKKITNELRAIMDKVYEQAAMLKASKQEHRREQWDRLQFTQQQLELLTEEVKQRISQLVEQVEQQVAGALNEEIRRLELLVNEFERPFHPDSLVLSVYKRELHGYVERGLGSNLRARLSSTLQMSVESSQKEMIGRMAPLIPQEQHPQMQNVLPRHNFEVLYRLNCESLCCDFQEDLEFRFSLGLVNLMKRFMGPRGAHAAMGGSYSPMVPRPQLSTPQTPSNEIKTFPTAPPDYLSMVHKLAVVSPSSQTTVGALAIGGFVPRPQLSTPQTPSNEIKTFPTAPPDYLSMVHKLAVVSPSSQTTVGALAIGGFMVRTVGWKVIAVTLGLYGVVYLFERLTWTNRAKERSFKRQYVQHATRKLRLIVDLTSANCSHQVQQELSSTFARLGHLVDEVVNDMEVEIKKLDSEIAKMDEATTCARTLRNKAGYLMSELETFSQQYLQYDQ